MTGLAKLVLDSYDRRARVGPALWCGVPLFASGLVLIPGLGTVWSLVGGLLVYCGGAMVLVQIGRGRGKVLESRLFDSWDGRPSVAMLRHRDSRLNSATKLRYRAFLEGAVPDLTLASPAEEQRDPDEAELGYDTANSWLLEQTRDHTQFDLLFAENMNYGFRRNLWALKPWALLAGALATAVAVAVAWMEWTDGLFATLKSIGVGWWVSVILVLVHALFFVFKVRQAWVRVAAEEYAQRLLAACDTLDGRRSRP